MAHKIIQRRLGDGEVQAKFAFVCADKSELTQKQFLYKIFQNVINAQRSERIETGHIDSFVAFVEGHSTKPAESVVRTFNVDGEVAYLTNDDVKRVLRKKIAHEEKARRQPGFVSTHPPRFLTQKKLVIVAGGTEFLMDNLHLYLEHEGLLRGKTFHFLKEVALLRPFPAEETVAHDLYFIDVHATATSPSGNTGFYPGNVEALGKVVRVKASGEAVVRNAEVLSSDEVRKKLGLKTEA